MDDEMTPETEVQEEVQAPAVNPIVARMRAKHADKAELPDDDMFGLADEHINELELSVADLTDYKERNTAQNEKLDAILKANPDLVAVIMDMDAGASFPVAIARNVDMESLTPQDGDPDYEGWNTAKSEREARLSEGTAFEEKLAQNKEFSQAELREFAAENNMSDEQALAFVDANVAPLLEDLAELKIGRNLLALLLKASTADAEREAAREEGALSMKNATAEDIMHPAPAGDGLPKADSAMVAEAEPAQKPMGYIEKLKNRS